MKMPLEPNIYKLIESENFRKRTAMFIGEKKISVLRGFINGYDYALAVNGLEDTNSQFDNFDDWIAKHYNWSESTAGWANILLVQCNGDEEKAVDEFFRLYDLFTGNNPTHQDILS